MFKKSSDYLKHAVSLPVPWRRGLIDRGAFRASVYEKQLLRFTACSGGLGAQIVLKDLLFALGSNF